MEFHLKNQMAHLTEVRNLEFRFHFELNRLFENDLGMMDIALLTANANQLRFLITYNSEEKTFIISATLIVLSLIVQLAVGIGMIYKVCLLSNLK